MIRRPPRSTQSRSSAASDVYKRQTNPGGRNIRFGVREHAMGAAVSGIALYGGFIPYASTFLIFSDYMRGAVRLAAMSRLRLVYVWTHDSIGVGEDGPTHEPVSYTHLTL